MRYYKTAIIILLFLSFLAACSHRGTNFEELVSANPGSFVQITFLGTNTEDNISKEVQIVKLMPDSAADQAGIRVNDVVLGIDSMEVKSSAQLRKIIFKKNPSDISLFKIRRNENILEKTVTFGKRYLTSDHYVLLQNIRNDKPVRLVILIGEISTTFKVDQGWHKGIESQLISGAENMYVNYFSNEKDCAVIDRGAVAKIQDEFKFQQSGYVSDELRVKLGKMFGATHILVLSFARFQSSAHGWQDIKYRKLIDVESGKILASNAIKDI